jgi:hypothetical protein
MINGWRCLTWSSWMVATTKCSTPIEVSALCLLFYQIQV